MDPIDQAIDQAVTDDVAHGGGHRLHERLETDGIDIAQIALGLVQHESAETVGNLDNLLLLNGDEQHAQRFHRNGLNVIA